MLGRLQVCRAPGRRVPAGPPDILRILGQVGRQVFPSLPPTTHLYPGLNYRSSGCTLHQTEAGLRYTHRSTYLHIRSGESCSPGDMGQSGVMARWGGAAPRGDPPPGSCRWSALSRFASRRSPKAVRCAMVAAAAWRGGAVGAHGDGPRAVTWRTSGRLPAPAVVCSKSSR